MKSKLLYFTGVVLLSFAIISCNSKAEKVHNHDEEEAHAHNEEAKGAHSDEIVITPEHAKSINLETYEVKPIVFNEIIRTSGQIVSAPGDESSVSATVSGIVSLSRAVGAIGVEVKQGASLFYISSKNVADGDYNARTKAVYEQAKAAYQRAEELVADKIISQKEFDQARYGYQTAKAAYDAIKSSSTAKGISIAAPMSGYLKDVLVKEGDYVNVGQPLATITKNRKLMLKAEVSERYYGSLSQITSANFKTSYDSKVYSLSNLNGKVVSYGKATSGDSYYIPVSFEFDNSGSIISGSFVDVYLIAKPISGVLAVPVSALTEEQGAYFVYVQIDAEGFRKQEVKLGSSNGVNVQILSGLKSGDRVVSRGAYEVKLASMSNVIPEGHSHNH